MLSAPKDHSGGAILFDLDGTLADTAPDLGGALNFVLEQSGRKPLPAEIIRPHVSRGANALLNLGFAAEPGDPGFDQLRQRFLDFYADNLCRHTRLFPGIVELLEEITGSGGTWGVVTNKPEAYTLPLLEQLPLPCKPSVIVSGDTLDEKKPSPEPLFHACRLCGVEPERSVYVGDDERDIDAARAAGMISIAVTYGYFPPGSRPAEWRADLLADDTGEISTWLRDRNLLQATRV